MQHDHLAFYGNSLSNVNNSITLGGAEVTPSLYGSVKVTQQFEDNRSNVEKHIAIVEYLKRIPKMSRVRCTISKF